MTDRLILARRPDDSFSCHELIASLHAVALTAEAASPEGLHDVDVAELDRLEGVSRAVRILAQMVLDRVE